jgi:hypothetical protein
VRTQFCPATAISKVSQPGIIFFPRGHLTIVGDTFGYYNLVGQAEWGLLLIFIG